MASLDRLPADQKAVLSLVLQRGRTFDEIAALLSIDRAAVRQRALEGFDALGPETSLDPLRRALITDYLLGQLPTAVADSVRTSLAAHPPERAWARVVAAEISPLAAAPLPEIPAPAGTPTAPGDVDRTSVSPPRAAAPVAAPPSFGAGALDPAEAHSGGTEAPSGGAVRASAPRSSRRGGAILLGLLGLVTAAVVVLVVVLLVSGGSSSNSHPAQTVPKAPPAATSSTGASTATSTPGTGTGTTQVTALRQINLTSPTGAKGAEGAADVVRAGSRIGLVIVAEGLSATTNNAYAVWLYNSKTSGSYFLGFYNQKVAGTGTAKGQLEAEVGLPANATSYDQLLLTSETTQKPTRPSSDVVLEGAFAE